MKLLLFLFKLVLLFGTVAFMISPLIAEYLSFRRDRKNKITHKRFRILLMSFVYFIGITIVLVLFKDLTEWIASWSIVTWLANQINFSNRFLYVVEIITVTIINFGIGLLFKILLSVIRIGLEKKDLIKPKGKNGEFSFSQKVERKILDHFNDEKWFFVGKIFKFLSISLIVVYSLFFIVYWIPVLWGADWIPYNFVLRLFESGYIYPIISLIPLCELFFFLSGVELLEIECPAFVQSAANNIQNFEPDIKKINEECKKLFKDYFVHEISEIDFSADVEHRSYNEITKLIAKGIETNSRQPKTIRDSYLKTLNTIVENDIGHTIKDTGEEASGVLINGSFFTDFSIYFLRYISVILARGDNVIFICNDKTQIEQTCNYVTEALERIYSLYYSESTDQSINFENPVWKIQKVAEGCTDIEMGNINNCSVLITDINFLVSKYFEQKCENFIHLIDTVVFVGVLDTVNGFSRQMSIFDAKMKNLRAINAIRAQNSCDRVNIKKRDLGASDCFKIRYTSHQIKYICFDDSRVPGLDKVLKNLLFVDFISADSMRYSPESVICCYNYEGHPDESGIHNRIQNAWTEEDLGVLVNMADFAIGFGAGKVSLFAEQNIPFNDIAESVDANANHGLTAQNGVNLLINTYNYDVENYRVMVVFDYHDNLPMAIRKYLTMVPDKPTLIMIFSRPYMLRDFYLANIEKLWKAEQKMRIPVEQSGKDNAIQKILVKANSGGISINEIFDILTDARIDDYKEVLRAKDIKETLRKILLDCGKHPHEALYWNDFFEFISFSDFDNKGQFVVEDRICLRYKNSLFTLLSGANPANVVIDGKEYSLPIPANRIAQKYIEGQNMLYNGEVYVINAIDVAKGKIFIKHATGGKNNVPYQYIQDREYHIVFSNTNPTRPYDTKQVLVNNVEKTKIREVKISVTERPMEVITRGYTYIDQRTLATNEFSVGSYTNIDCEEHFSKFIQAYRKYGDVKSSVVSTEMIIGRNIYINASPNGALVMSVKIDGDFEEDNSRITLLASVMIGELLHSMFPSVADSIAVCPVINRDVFTDEDSLNILKTLPKVHCREYQHDVNSIEILIIEDCSLDIGVISVLMSSGDDVLKMLFEPVYEYLNWYKNSTNKSNYLYFGQKHEPLCFDFEGLFEIAKIIGEDNFNLKFVNIENITLYDVCDFCGKRYVKGPETSLLEDGRRMCKTCAENLVGNNKNVFKSHLDRARIFLESTYGINIDDDYELCFESTVKIVNTLKQNRNLVKKGSNVPLKSYVDDKKKVHVEYSIPSVNLSELLVRELTHVWQLKYLPEVAEDIAEGHIALVAVQYLRFLNQTALASVRTTYYESTGNSSGEGYRKLVKALLENPQYNNNPFRYLLEASGREFQGAVLSDTTPRTIEHNAFGLKYTPAKFDRILDGNVPQFYFSRLTPKNQKAYEIFASAIQNHQETVVFDGYSFDDIQNVSRAIRNDHPDYFWYDTFSKEGSLVKIQYGASKEESAELQRKIDEVVNQYLAEIDDSMSAYDVTMRLHAKIIASVDYDTIALNKQKEKGGHPSDAIDYLRTICGVFLNGAAVCAGYARAMQYLLQKCGIESGYVSGEVVNRKTGKKEGRHGWNIIKLDGDYYYLDVTNDDKSDTIQEVKNHNFGFSYFCITTDELTRKIDIDEDLTGLPVCVATKCNYFYLNDYIIETYDLNKLKKIAEIAAKNKSKAFEFKCKSKALYEHAFNQLCVDGKDCFEILKAVSKIDSNILANKYFYSYNDNIWTIQVQFRYK